MASFFPFLSDWKLSWVLQLDNHRNQLIQVLYPSVYRWDLRASHLLIYLYFFNFGCSLDLQLELFLSSGTVCLSIYSLVGAIFGMNIPYTWNDDHGYMFKWVHQETRLQFSTLNSKKPETPNKNA